MKITLGDKVVVWQLTAGFITSGIVSDITKYTSNSKQHLSTINDNLSYGDAYSRLHGITCTALVNFHEAPHGPYNIEDIFPDSPTMRATLSQMTILHDDTTRRMSNLMGAGIKIKDIPMPILVNLGVR